MYSNRKQSYAGGMGYRYSPMRSFLGWVARIALVLFLIWGLTGGVNWAVTGQNIWNWTKEISYNVSTFVFDREGSPIVPSYKQSNDGSTPSYPNSSSSSTTNNN